MGKVRYAFPLSVFHKIVYAVCIFCLPMVFDIRFVFYVGSISDAVGAAFSLLLFFAVINPKLKKGIAVKYITKNQDETIMGKKIAELGQVSVKIVQRVRS